MTLDEWEEYYKRLLWVDAILARELNPKIRWLIAKNEKLQEKQDEMGM
jgi:hypothetical protein